jgi:hypothetical protein
MGVVSKDGFIHEEKLKRIEPQSVSPMHVKSGERPSTLML